MGSGGFRTSSGGFPTRTGGFHIRSGGFPAGFNALRIFPPESASARRGLPAHGDKQRRHATRAEGMRRMSLELGGVLWRIPAFHRVVETEVKQEMHP
jgi:hypothetical protein